MNEVSTSSIAVTTVREVANVLGVSERVVQMSVKKLYPEHVVNGKATLLNESMATSIKLDLQSHHNLEGTFEAVTTDIEMMDKAREVMSWLAGKVEEEKTKRIEAERKNAILMHVSKTYTASEIAKEIGMRSATEFNQELERRGIQYFQNGTWIPCADYAQLGYFNIKQQVLDNGKVVYNRHFTQDGRAFIVDMFKRVEAGK
jgi:hypothetical protein